MMKKAFFFLNSITFSSVGLVGCCACFFLRFFMGREKKKRRRRWLRFEETRHALWLAREREKLYTTSLVFYNIKDVKEELV